MVDSSTWSDAQSLAYIASYPDLISSLGANPDAGRQHYAQYGAAEGRTISFNALDYIASYGDLIAALGDNPAEGAEHYIRYGYVEGRVTSFDPYLYIAANTDLIAAIGDNPVAGAEHYIDYGHAEGRVTAFDALDYVASYSDLITAIGANVDRAAEHYIDYGHAEGRTISFDPYLYIAANADLIAAIGDNPVAGAEHYIEYGHAEGRTTTFDSLDYVASYGDLITAIGADADRAAEHYIEYGYAEGRSATFDAVAYLLSQPDLQAEGLGPEGALKEWVQEGYAEGRSGDSTFGHEQASHELVLDQAIRAAIDVVGDHDWYQMALTAGQTVTLDMQLAGTTGTAYLGVNDASGHALAATDLSSAGDPQEALTSFTAPTDGIYYVTASASGGYSGDYTLDAQTGPVQIGGPTDDTFDDFLRYNDPAATIVMDGGAGNDSLIFEREEEHLGGGLFTDFVDFARIDAVTVLGGSGNDVINVGAAGRADIDAGAGDDIVTASLATISQRITLGAGADTLNIGATLSEREQMPGTTTYLTLSNFATTVTDFQVGVDHLNIDNLLSQTDIRVIQSGADALMQGHIGPPGTTDWTTLITFEHNDAVSLAHGIGLPT